MSRLKTTVINGGSRKGNRDFSCCLLLIYLYIVNSADTYISIEWMKMRRLWYLRCCIEHTWSLSFLITISWETPTKEVITAYIRAKRQKEINIQFCHHHLGFGKHLHRKQRKWAFLFFLRAKHFSYFFLIHVRLGFT